jgi:C4-dicarboxylate-specific signal transduction histidine kinase
LRAGLEAEVQKKTLYLTRIIEELEAEIKKRDQMEEVIKTQKDLLRQSCRPTRSNLPSDWQVLPNVRF